MDILSDYGNMDIMLGEGNSNSVERELDNILNGPEIDKTLGQYQRVNVQTKRMKLGTYTVEMTQQVMIN